MRQDKLIHIVFSVIILVLISAVLFVQMLNLSHYQKNGADKILTDISFDLKTGGIKTDTLQSMPENELFLVLVKDDIGQLSPLFYDNRYFDSENPDFEILHKKVKNKLFEYKREINGYSFVVWINKYNPSYIIKYIALPTLFALLIYMAGTILIILLFGSYGKEELYKVLGDDEDDDIFNIKKEREVTPVEEKETIEVVKDISSDDTIDEEVYEENVEEESFVKNGDEISVEMENISEIDTDGTVIDKVHQNLIEDDYKELWGKNFKISDDFFDNFPFEKLYDLLGFNTTPDEYILESLKVASSYFKWSGSRVYISQKDGFVDADSKQVLDQSLISIPADGTAKGRCYIPLYPYNKNKIFGYFYFNWEREENFFISDILYFLKFTFSSDAKYIFMNFKDNQATKDNIQNALKQKSQFFIGFIKVDDGDNYKIDYKEDEVEILNTLIFDNLKNNIDCATFFKVFPLYYGFYGSNIAKEDLKNKLQGWMEPEDNHSYHISNKIGNIAVTFSGGINFKKSNNVTLNRFLYEAEDALRTAFANGGDQLIIK